MKLRDLEAHFTKYRERAPDPALGESVNQPPICTFERVETLAEADGVRFVCPLCKSRNEWAHPIFIGFHGRAKPGTYGHNKEGKPMLWNVVGGTGLDDLRLSPSIQIQGGCNWHGFVGSNGVPPGEAR